MPFVLNYCKIANESLSYVMEEAVSQVFYVVSFDMLRQEDLEKKLKQKSR